VTCVHGSYIGINNFPIYRGTCRAVVIKDSIFIYRHESKERTHPSYFMSTILSFVSRVGFWTMISEIPHILSPYQDCSLVNNQWRKIVSEWLRDGGKSCQNGYGMAGNRVRMVTGWREIVSEWLRDGCLQNITWTLHNGKFEDYRNCWSTIFFYEAMLRTALLVSFWVIKQILDHFSFLV